jgi:RIO-like serine/threonine protein kinase
MTEIVEGLHAQGIVWGDVHPMNVVIDEQMDAWAIDFGGMNNVHFVDDANRDTEVGDLQGLRKIFKEWLPDQEKRGKR